MVLTNKEMFDSLAVFTKVKEKGLLGFAIAKNKRRIMSEIQEYVEKRDELLKKYGEDIGDGKFQLLQKDAEKFFKEIQPYNDLSIDIPVMQVSQEVFYSGNLDSSEMFMIDWMVREETSE